MIVANVSGQRFSGKSFLGQLSCLPRIKDQYIIAMTDQAEGIHASSHPMRILRSFHCCFQVRWLRTDRSFCQTVQIGFPAIGPGARWQPRDLKRPVAIHMQNLFNHNRAVFRCKSHGNVERLPRRVLIALGKDQVAVPGRVAHHAAVNGKVSPSNVDAAQTDCASDAAVGAVARPQISKAGIHPDLFGKRSVHLDQKVGGTDRSDHVESRKVRIAKHLHRGNDHRQVLRLCACHHGIRRDLLYRHNAVARRQRICKNFLWIPACSGQHLFDCFRRRRRNGHAVCISLFKEKRLELLERFIVIGAFKEKIAAVKFQWFRVSLFGCQRRSQHGLNLINRILGQLHKAFCFIHPRPPLGMQIDLADTWQSMYDRVSFGLSVQVVAGVKMHARNACPLVNDGRVMSGCRRVADAVNKRIVRFYLVQDELRFKGKAGNNFYRRCRMPLLQQLLELLQIRDAVRLFQDQRNSDPIQRFHTRCQRLSIQRFQGIARVYNFQYKSICHHLPLSYLLYISFPDPVLLRIQYYSKIQYHSATQETIYSISAGSAMHGSASLRVPDNPSSLAISTK